ncbi:hypothetical protein WJX73_006477 [Symbiochloris irregularis]|uniref:Structural maintenance of chromosomes protein n=1 Tax=Symbiochloris irregularis TaxID=706552 RepID=A0AAW1NX63_9CHLO
MDSTGGHRLIITDLVLENFKSYAGEQRVGPFHQRFSSVIGPNGSGKSNVIDAMLFVFGKRAKQLRLSKVSELIHKSTHHRNLDTARVTVNFQEINDLGEQYTVVPDSGFSVTRTAHRNNTSNYYINQRRSNFGEVTEMLKGKGIDLDNNRFLILQGEVEQISMMKPKAQTPHDSSLLGYLEDIIGTQSYVAPIEESAKRLEEIGDRRAVLLGRARATQRERDALEGAKAAAEAYRDKESQCYDANATLLQLFIRDGMRNLDTAQKMLGELDVKLQHEQTKLKDYMANVGAAEQRHAEEQGAHDSVAKELDKAKGEFSKFEQRDVKIREDLKHLKTKRRKFQDVGAKAKIKAQELESAATDADAAAPLLRQKGEELSAQLLTHEKALEEVQEGVKEEVEGHTRALQGVQGDLAPWKAKVADVQARHDLAAAEHGLLATKQKDALLRLQEAKSGAEDAKQAAQAKEQEVHGMEAQLVTCSKELAEARTETGQAEAAMQGLEARQREVRGRLNQKRAELEAQASQGAVVKALMAAKTSGQLPGIYGRLGDLGAIDAKYDVAVSTAGGALNMILVEDTATAQKGVDLLRNSGVGVATFLILEKQMKFAAEMNQQCSPPEGVPRLFDLVRVSDPKLQPAFFYALRNTVVAQDLDQASRIAYGSDARWKRVVTLKGEIINESGTMTGGGAQPRGGRMRLGSSAPRPLDTEAAAADLAKEEQTAQGISQELQLARERLSGARAAVKAAEKAVNQLERGIPCARLQAQAHSDSARDLSSRLDSLQAATQVAAEDVQRMKALEKDMQVATRDLEALRSSMAQLQRKAEELQKAVDEAGGPKLKRLRSLVSETQQAITEAENEATRKEVQAKTARKAAQKTVADESKAATQLAGVVEDIAAREAEMKAMENSALKVMDRVQAREKELAAKATTLETISEEFERVQKEVGIIRQVEVDLQFAIREQQDMTKAEQDKIKGWGKRAAEARSRLAAVSPAGTVVEPKTDEQLEEHTISDLRDRVCVLEEELKAMDPDMGAIEAAARKDAEYATRLAELDAASAERDQVRRTHDDMRKRRLNEFMSGFNSISLKLKEMYQMITLGGDAELELVDSLDPFTEGIVFSVRPPKKSWKNISNLSGGEKTLASLALVFALHHYKPTPLYVMDEIDAALDFRNVSIVAHYIKERTKNAQFIIISLRNNMFELAERLIGIYKVDNASKSAKINPGQHLKQAGTTQSMMLTQQALIPAK